MVKHHKKLSEVWDSNSNFAKMYGITDFMHGYTICVLASVWKYGEELRTLYNAKYHYEGDGVVNPAVYALLTISA